MTGVPTADRPSAALFVTSAGICAGYCTSSFTGGKCARCDMYWYRDENGKMIGVRWSDLTAFGVVPATTIREPLALDDRDDPRSHDLGAAVELSKEMPPDLAEAVDGLVRLWNATLRNLPERQAQALLLVHTRRSLSSLRFSELAKISPQNASNVLKHLVEKGLVKAVRDGNRVNYETAFVWPTGLPSRAAQIAMRRIRRVDNPLDAEQITETVE